MELTIGTRFKKAFNAFLNKDPTENVYSNYGVGYGSRIDRPRFSRGNEKSIVTSIYNRIATDVSAININHVELDKDGRYKSTRESGLNTCLTLEANIDQTGRALIQDIVISMLDEGAVAVVPTYTSKNMYQTDSYDIYELRTGKILEWYPDCVRVRLYDDRTGQKKDLTLPKRCVAIIENPFYAVMNEYNSTMQRLIRKLNLLDVIDEQSGAGKLDLIIQLPYVIKSEARRQQAESRRKDIENQLAGSKYGIAYTDGTEHVTQLNRPVENNLLKTIEYLTNMLYSQLGITQTILDGSADEQTMLNYNNNTVEPIVSAIANEFKRKFLTQTARTQGQSIMFFRDPFRLVPVGQIAEIADKFTRNEIASKNEFRQILGWKPSNDPKADQLINSNISQSKEVFNSKPENKDEKSEEDGEIQNGV